MSLIRSNNGKLSFATSRIFSKLTRSPFLVLFPMWMKERSLETMGKMGMSGGFTVSDLMRFRYRLKFREGSMMP